MEELYLTGTPVVSRQQLEAQLDRLLEQWPGVKKVLVIPPDYTRCYSYAGVITQLLYQKLSPSATVHVMPALGTHMPMDEYEMSQFFGDVVPREIS